MKQQNKFGSLEDIINSIIPLDELVNKVFIGQDRTRLFKYHFTFDLETTNKLIDGLSKLGVVGASQEFALASIANYIGEEANKRRSDMLTKRADTSMNDPYINIGGTYAEAIRALGLVPEEYILPLSLMGIGHQVNNGESLDKFIGWLKAAVEGNPELGYLALSVSPRGQQPIHAGSIYYYLQSTIVGILLSRDYAPKEIKEKVDACEPQVQAIVDYSTNHGRDAILGLTPQAMIGIAVIIISDTPHDPKDADWSESPIYGLKINGNALDGLTNKPQPTSICDKYPSPFPITEEGLLAVMDYPNQLDSNPCLDTLVTYNGKLVTKREALEHLRGKVRALVADANIDFFSVGSVKSAVANISTTTGMSEADIMLMMGEVNQGKYGYAKVSFPKQRTGGLHHLDPFPKSGIGLKKITDAIAEGKPVTVVMDDSEMSINPKRFVVLGAGGPRISGSMGLISDLHHGHYNSHWSEDVHSDYNKGDVFVTKSSRDEIIKGKNRTWPKAKTRKGKK